MRYAKFVAMVVATILTAVVGSLTDGVFTTGEGVNVAIAGVTAAAVFTGPNIPGARYTKAVLAVLGAVLVALTSMLTGGISTAELAQLAVVALGAVGVYAVPMDSNPTGRRALSEDPGFDGQAGHAEVIRLLVIAGAIVLAGVVLGLLNQLVDVHLGIS